MPTFPPRSAAPFCCQVPVAPGHASLTAGQWMLVCVAVLVTVYFVMRSGRRKKADPLARPASAAGLAQQRAVERQMQNLLVELSEMARQITAQLDTRATKLALLIDDADEKAAMLQRLLDQYRAALTAPPPPAPPPPPAVPPAAAPPTPPEPAAFEPSLALVNEADARNDQIYALADQGLSAAAIAHQLDRHHGEVELIIALRPSPAAVTSSLS